MADFVTNLGETLEEHQDNNGETDLHKVFEGLVEALTQTEDTVVTLCDLSISGKFLLHKNMEFIKLDDRAYEILASYLKIPVNYLMTIEELEVRNVNVMYWFRRNSDKEAIIVHEGDMLVDIRTPKVQLVDILSIVLNVLEDTELFRVNKPTNDTVMDILGPKTVRGNVDTYRAGLRLRVCTTKMKGPDIYPIIVSEESCGIIAISESFAPVNIKNMDYQEALIAIEKQIKNAWDAVDGILEGFAKMHEIKFENPEKMINLLCKEHHLVDRTRNNLKSRFVTSGLDTLDGEQMCMLFGVIGYVKEIKWKGWEQTQRVAGHILLRHTTEHRCPKCKNLLSESD